jgi:hypothetical protein
MSSLHSEEAPRINLLRRSGAGDLGARHSAAARHSRSPKAAPDSGLRLLKHRCSRPTTLRDHSHAPRPLRPHSPTTACPRAPHGRAERPPRRPAPDCCTACCRRLNLFLCASHAPAALPGPLAAAPVPRAGRTPVLPRPASRWGRAPSSPPPSRRHRRSFAPHGGRACSQQAPGAAAAAAAPLRAAAHPCSRLRKSRRPQLRAASASAAAHWGPFTASPAARVGLWGSARPQTRPPIQPAQPAAAARAARAAPQLRS